LLGANGLPGYTFKTILLEISILMGQFNPGSGKSNGQFINEIQLYDVLLFKKL